MSVETAREATRKKEAKETLQERPNRGVVMGEGLGDSGGEGEEAE